MSKNTKAGLVGSTLVECEGDVPCKTRLRNSLEQLRSESRDLGHVPSKKPAQSDVEVVRRPALHVTVVFIIDDVSRVEDYFISRLVFDGKRSKVSIKSRLEPAGRYFIISSVLRESLVDHLVGNGEVQEVHHVLVVVVRGNRVAVSDITAVGGFFEDVSVRSAFCVDEVACEEEIVV